jgi:hypothetical protein
MYKVIEKADYFSWYERGIADKANHTLKGIQDSFVLAQLHDAEGLIIAEVGGGHSRILKRLEDRNECWNIDKFEGAGNGPKSLPTDTKAKIVQTFVGEYDPQLPSDYFDCVFSISVIEHIPPTQLKDFFADCFRMLKSGGRMYHAIDAYVADVPNDYVNELLGYYRDYVEAAGFRWIEHPESLQGLTFKPHYASNSDLTMAMWNAMVPNLKEKRIRSQSISLQLGAIKP